MVVKSLRKFILITAIFISVVYVSPILASSTDGTIDATGRYAWGENIGWIDFGTTNGAVHVTDAGLTGSALSENVGWIDLSNVINDGAGNLSGYGWGENIGWVNFHPANGGVIINSSGEFTGSALSENVGWIIFNTEYKVKTDWRPRSARPACNNTLDDDGDGKTDYPLDPGCASLEDTDETDPATGGGMPTAWISPPTAPVEGFSVSINNGASEVDSTSVTLTLRGGSDTARMAISNSADFVQASQENYTQNKNWNLCQEPASCPEGEYRVYAIFYTSWGQPSEAVSASVTYRKTKPVVEQIIEIPDKIVEEVKKIPEAVTNIPKILAPIVSKILQTEPAEDKSPDIPIESLVPKETPVVFLQPQNLLSETSINQLALAPLPREILALSNKFPQLAKTLAEVGVNKFSDLEKLKSVTLTLPGLTEGVSLSSPTVDSGYFALAKGIPVAELPVALKEKMPTDIVFAKSAGELIDFNISLSINDDNVPEQKISIIAGKSLQLSIKPDNPVKSVKGYIVFRSAGSKNSLSADVENETISSIINNTKVQLEDLAYSVLFGSPVFAQPSNGKITVEEKLVLLAFEYTDPDGDGIYTTEVQLPVTEGEYEVITVMTFEDPELGMKEVRLITVVDPEGFVYAQLPGGKMRIEGVEVSLYWMNPTNKQYELWPAKEYQQKNPQITDDTGKYSFLVPPGVYYLTAESSDYSPYQSEEFTVKEGSGVHMNIELKNKNWWIRYVDWKVVVMFIFGALLFYNFYRDRRRSKRR